MAGGTQARFDRWAHVTRGMSSRGVTNTHATQASARRAFKHFETLAKNMTKCMEAASLEAAKVVQLEIGHEIDRWADNPTGKLERSFKIRKQPMKSVSGLQIMASTVVSDSPYWKIHEYGGTIIQHRARVRRLIEIASKRPRSKSSLVTVRIRIHAKHYVKRAVDHARPRFTAILSEAARRAQKMSDGI